MLFVHLFSAFHCDPKASKRRAQETMPHPQPKYMIVMAKDIYMKWAKKNLIIS